MMSPVAKIYTFTVVRVSSKEFMMKVPYVIALAEMDGQKRSVFVDDYHDGTKVNIGDPIYFDRMDEKNRPIYKLNP